MLPLIEANALSHKTHTLAGQECVSSIIGHIMPISILCKELLISFIERIFFLS